MKLLGLILTGLLLVSCGKSEAELRKEASQEYAVLFKSLEYAKTDNEMREIVLKIEHLERVYGFKRPSRYVPK